MTHGFRPAPGTSPNRHAPVVLGLIALCAVPEIALTLSAMPSLGLDLRRSALIHGAFWPGLLRGWQPVFGAQPVTMFVTHAFLHAGLMHLVFNMIILAHLGREGVARLGQGGFLLLYLLSAIGGAAAFWLMSSSDGPMVGASGAIFGLFGMAQWWDWQRRRAIGASTGPVWRLAFGLVVMNVLLWFLVAGYLAWQAHLGGYVTGFVLARIVTPTLRHGARGFG